jgi:carbon starvation protein
MSLAAIARMEIGPVAGFTCGIAILFVIVIALAGLGFAVVNALAESPWGVFTIGMTIPLALFMSLYMYKIRPGKIGEATVIGVVGLLLAVAIGKPIAASSFGQVLTLSKHTLIIWLAVYGFAASSSSTRPCRCPRSRSSSAAADRSCRARCFRSRSSRSRAVRSRAFTVSLARARRAR